MFREECPLRAGVGRALTAVQRLTSYFFVVVYYHSKLSYFTFTEIRISCKKLNMHFSHFDSNNRPQLQLIFKFQI